MLKLNTKKFSLFTLSGLFLTSHHTMLQAQACGSLLSGCCKLTGIIATGCCDASCCLLRAFCCCTLSDEVSYTEPKPDIRPGEWPEEADLRRQIEQLQRRTNYLGTSQQELTRLQMEIIYLQSRYSRMQMRRVEFQARRAREEKLAAEKLAQEQAVQARMEPTSLNPLPVQQ